MRISRQYGIPVAAMAVAFGLVAWAGAKPGVTAMRPQAEGATQLGAILSAREAYVLLPPEMVSGPRVGQVSVSPGGTYLLVERHTAPRLVAPGDTAPVVGEVSLAVWDFSTRRGGTLWRDTSSQKDPLGYNWTQHIRGVDWLPTTNLAFVTISDESNGGDIAPLRVVVVDAARRTIRPLLTGTNEDSLFVAQTQPVAAFFAAEAQTITVMGANGAVRQTWNVTEPNLFWLGWQEDGKTLYGTRVSKNPNPAEKPRRENFLFDITTGQVTPFTGKHTYRELPAMKLPPLKVTIGKGEIRHEEATVRLSPLWLEGTEAGMTGRALVTPDGGQGGILPRAVLFQSNGALYAAPIEKMDRAAYLALRREQLKRQAMNQAKQIGLGMMMYCQDYDENFPPVGSDLRGIVDPYLKNDSVWNNPESGQFGFTAAYKATGLASFESPATTPLGYLTGPGGRVIIFVDGHVRWEDGP